MTFDSVYEIRTPLPIIKKNWFVDYFDGTDLKSYWDTHVRSGGDTTFGMVDEVGEGFEILTAGLGNGLIGFNDINPFDPKGMELIWIGRRPTANTSSDFGVWKEEQAIVERFEAIDSSASTFKSMITQDASGNTLTDSSVPVDTNWTKYYFIARPTVITLTINGILEITHTTDLTDADMFPKIRNFRLSGSDSRTRARYCEVFNV